MILCTISRTGRAGDKIRNWTEIWILYSQSASCLLTILITKYKETSLRVAGRIALPAAKCLLFGFKLDTLSLGRFALDMTGARKSFTADTIDRIAALGLIAKSQHLCKHNPSEVTVVSNGPPLRPIMQKRWTHLEVLIRGFLPFLGHRSRRWFRQRVDSEENCERNSNTNRCIKPNFCPFARRGLCSGAVRSKCNPPCCTNVSNGYGLYNRALSK